MSRRAVFLDKDGTLVINVPYNVDPSRIALLPGADLLAELQAIGYLLIVITNQAGVAHGYFAEGELAGVRVRLTELLAAVGARLDGFYYCPHHPDAELAIYRRQCDCRKPAAGLLLQAARDYDIDLNASWFVGDILDDVEAGNRAGCRTILIDAGSETQWQISAARLPDYRVSSLAEAMQLMMQIQSSSDTCDRNEVSGRYWSGRY